MSEIWLNRRSNFLVGTLELSSGGGAGFSISLVILREVALRRLILGEGTVSWLQLGTGEDSASCKNKN